MNEYNPINSSRPHIRAAAIRKSRARKIWDVIAAINSAVAVGIIIFCGYTIIGVLNVAAGAQ
jgi:hypothetical protein